MSKTEKGVLSTLVEKLIAKVGDAAIDASGLIEMADGPLIGAAISLLDNHFAAKYIPEDIATGIRNTVDQLVIQKDKNEAVMMASHIQLMYLNIPGFDDELEKQIVSGMLDIAFGFIIKAIDITDN